MRYILSLIALVVLMSCMAACGSKTSGEESETVAESVDEQNTQLAEAPQRGQYRPRLGYGRQHVAFVDDFTPEQTVQVLMAFLSVHNDAVAAKERRRDLETIRKYIDVYDIAVSTNPKDTRAAFAKAKRINPEVDFDSIAVMFRERLAQYDAIQDGTLNAPEPAAADSAAADSVAEEIPLELRPAE